MLLKYHKQLPQQTQVMILKTLPKLLAISIREEFQIKNCSRVDIKLKIMPVVITAVMLWVVTLLMDLIHQWRWDSHLDGYKHNTWIRQWICLDPMECVSSKTAKECLVLLWECHTNRSALIRIMAARNSLELVQ